MEMILGDGSRNGSDTWLGDLASDDRDPRRRIRQALAGPRPEAAVVGPGVAVMKTDSPWIPEFTVTTGREAPDIEGTTRSVSPAEDQLAELARSFEDG